jgi:hypothetical protein
VSGLIGAGLALWLLPLSEATRQRNHALKPIREEFVPVQDLQLTDGLAGSLGNIRTDENFVSLNLYPGGNLFLTGQVSRSALAEVIVQCASVGIVVYPNEVSIQNGTNEAIRMEWIHLRNDDDHPTASDRLLRIFHRPSPSPVKQFDDPDVIPTEDLHLRDRNGWVFAAMGLGATGDPGIAFADSKGVRLVWFQHKSDLEPDWWELAVWDGKGYLRLDIKARPGQPLDLVVYPDDIATQYVADFASHRLVQQDSNHGSKLTFLAAVSLRSRLPIQLTDNRGRKLWSGP